MEWIFKIETVYVMLLAKCKTAAINYGVVKTCGLVPFI